MFADQNESYQRPRRPSANTSDFTQRLAALHGQCVLPESRRRSGACIQTRCSWTTVHGKPTYTLWLFSIAMENPLYMEVFIGKSSINGPFSMAMLNNQRIS